MPTNRVISAVEALYTSSSPATGATQTVTQLHRVQSVSYNWGVNRVNVNQYGQLAPISREINDTPTVSLDFSYYVVNFLNEYNLGFVTDGSTSAISGLLSKATDEKNYYLVQAPEGQDNIGYSGTDRVTYGIGNGFMSSYSTEARVGGFPTATVRVEGLNLVGYPSMNGQTPALNPTDGARATGTFSVPVATSGAAGAVPVIKHGDITLNLGSSIIGVNLDDAKIQRYTLSFNLRRTPQNKLGSRFAINRNIDFPIDVTLSVEMELGDIATGSVSDLFCNDIPYTLSLFLRKPACSGSGPMAAAYTLYGAKLDSANFSSSLGANKTVTAQWSTSLGGPSDTGVGLFMSGVLA